MTLTNKDKEDTSFNKLYKLLLETDSQIIKDSLSTKLTSQKGKEVRIEILRREKLLTDKKEYLK